MNRSTPLPLFRGFFLLLFARIGPQDMPAGWRPVLQALFAFVVIGVLVAQAADGTVAAGQNAAEAGPGLGGNLLLTLVDAAVLAGYTALWARLRDKRARIPQALTALFGVSAMLSLLTWPLVALGSGAPVDATGASPTWWDWAMVGLFAWNLFALGQIYRHTLTLGPGAGVLVALGYFLLSTAVVFWLAPGLIPAPQTTG